MYVKIINPRINGQKVFDNAGSALRTINYLAKEAKAAGREATFFTSPYKGPLTADEVVDLIDSNQKGLRQLAAKFYSLVLSPGTTELAVLGSDRQLLAAYTQEAMDLYAKNFKIKSGQELRETDLVWAATVHEERKNRGTDVGMQGQPKHGLQTHVHVIVSARDASQKHTLNPLATVTHFSRVQYQAQACVQLHEQLGQEKIRSHNGEIVPTREQQVAEKARDIQARAAANRQKKVPTAAQLQARDERLDGLVARVNGKRSEYQQLDSQQVKASAEARGYDAIFYRRLRQVELNAEKGTYTPAPYAYLKTGLVQREETGPTAPIMRPEPAAKLVPYQAEKLVFPDARQSFERALQALTRTLDAQQAYAHQQAETVKSAVPVAPPVPTSATATGLPVLALMAVVEVPTKKSNPAEDSSARERLLTPDEELKRRKAAEPATTAEAAQTAAGEARAELADQTRQRVTAAAAMAQQTGASLAFLLRSQNLEVVTQEDGQLVGVRPRASGALFTTDEVPMPAAAQLLEGKPLVQYGFIELGAAAGKSAEERLEKCRVFLADSGIMVGQVVPAAVRQAAHLTYCFAVDQVNQEQVADKLNRLQNAPAARIYEAPHPLQTPATPAMGVAVPQAQWRKREGQFNQAKLVLDLQKTDTPRLAGRIREMLLQYGAAVGKVLDDGHGHLEITVHYHTHTPSNEKVQSTLDGAKLAGVEVRQHVQAAQALTQGVAELGERHKEPEIPQHTM